MTGSDATPGSQLKSSITEASRKIEGIIDDAERAAAEIRAEARADAERETRRQIAEGAAKLSEVVQPLVKRVEDLRVEAAGLVHEIEAATLNLVSLTKEAEETAAAAESKPAETAPELATEPESPTQNVPDVAEAPLAEPDPGPAPIAYPGTRTQTASEGGPPEEAMLRATQMAVAGNSRAEIEAALSDEFNLSDPSPVVDDILGPA